MRASLVVIPVVALAAGLVCGGAVGYMLGARSAMDNARSAIQAAVEKERAALRDRAADAGTALRSQVQDRLQEHASGAAGAQPAGGSVAERLANARLPVDAGGGGRQRLDPKRQRCVGGFVREFGDGTDAQGRRIGGERDLIENGRRVECSGLLRK
jgi:hypothetical protein